ncbi:MAG: PLP-dependent aminotransferase family protein [Lautropia sp.]
MSTPLSRTASVMQAIRTRIASRALGAGDRLPSIRSIAATLAVSPATVVEAYDRLVAEGLIRARRGSGFYVSAAALPPLALAAGQPPADRAVDPFWVSRQSLDADPAAALPGCGWLPSEWLPGDALRRAMRALARGNAAVLSDYGSTRGSLALRRQLLARCVADGIDASPEQLLLTASGSQAIDLVLRLLLRKGDTVVVDDPCYFNFRALLRAHQVSVVGVPVTAWGPDLAAFARVLAERQPRLYLTNSAVQNPTGATLSAQTAHRLLNLAAAHDLTIVEDDIFADFEPEPSPRLAALDGLQRVIRIGSFSKTLSASIRCGYVAARRDWIDELVDLQVATSFGGPSPIATEAIASVLASGGYRRHLDELRRRLARARRDAAEKLGRVGIEPWLQPRAGFYLWCRLPDGTDSAAVARAALADRVVLAPGNVFSAAQTAGGFMRFNVARTTDPKVIATLARAIATSRTPAAATPLAASAEAEGAPAGSQPVRPVRPA